MSEVVHLDRTSVFTRAMGKPDNRPIIVARCYGAVPTKIGFTEWAEPLAAISAVAMNLGRGDHGPAGQPFEGDDPAAFWRWAISHVKRRQIDHQRYTGRKALLLFGDANRDLAMLGAPDGYAFKPTDKPCGHIKGDCFNRRGDAHHSFSGTLGGSDPHSGGFDVHQVGNWHHEGAYAEALDIGELVDWARQWRITLDDYELGPKWQSTPARQALRSFRRHCAIGDAHGKPYDGIRCHLDDDLHRFEWEAMAAQFPVRMTVPGHYERLHYLDFVAHYPSIMARYPLPTEPLQWWPTGDVAPNQLAIMVNRGNAIIAHVTLDDGERRIVTTPDFDAGRVAEVRRAATYSTRGSAALASWAEAIFTARQQCSDVVRPTVKMVANSLWGALAQRNWQCLDRVAPDHLDDMEGPLAVKCEDGSEWCVDAGGNYRERAPWLIQRDRFYALGAHMLAYGRMLTEALMTGLDVVHAHTDSVWSTTPVIGTNSYPGEHYLGGLKQAIVRDVILEADGLRTVGGRIDAHGGGKPHKQGRFYTDFDDAEVTTGQPHAAAFQWFLYHDPPRRQLDEEATSAQPTQGAVASQFGGGDQSPMGGHREGAPAAQEPPEAVQGHLPGLRQNE